MKIVVIDGQGGALGKHLIAAVKSAAATDASAEIIAVGTNSAATSAMMNGGADRGATGENPIIVACSDADIIVGPVGILCANAMLGEITPTMALAVGAARAVKILVPVSRCDIMIAGASEMSYGEYVKIAARMVAGEIKKKREK
ncbi:MAG: DUF3842 family protein [Synergistaceae bacterium]|jgi:hypothetical protein|nr:DUF3842 family protein [Synergistaceae bacterium]